MEEIKVIVVDDSILMRNIISDMINEAEDIEVISTAKNGEELFSLLEKELPDVITLDVEMPGIDGLEVLKVLREKKLNIPTIMLSSLSKKGAEITMRCLELGAFEFIPKPSGQISLDITKLKEELIDKIRVAKEKRRGRNKNPFIITSLGRRIQKNLKPREGYKALVIGASTGGPKALNQLFSSIQRKLEVPVFVVQHMPEGFTKAFAERLNKISPMEIKEAVMGELIEKNKVYIAPGGYHIEISEGIITLNKEEPHLGVRPSVDKLFHSAAKNYKNAVISVVLTGMGKDGASGTVDIKAYGGYTISEDKESCTIYGMPKATFETGCVDEVLTLENIPKRLEELLIDRG